MAKAAKQEIQPGDVLGGKYRIERVIGQGGMGIVAAARHAELQRRVAIKVLPVHLAPDRDLVERFMREARAAARLRSEHAVRVVDVGSRENGSPYIVMELLEGEDLGALSERGPLPVPVAVDYILQTCEAVAEAHAHGILHRDLKPKNLFLSTRLHGKPIVKVLDFGLAKSIDMQDRVLTATATVMGSPQYMSPEQMRAARDIDFRTDIWSLGVCLYELLSSRVPFESGAVPVLCAMVLKDDPMPLPRYRPDVPPALWGVIQRCLMKDRTLRYVTVSELAVALEPFAAAEALGAAERIAGVLAAVRALAAESPGALGGIEKTRIAASIDSTPRRERATSAALWSVIGGVSLFLVLAIVGGVLVVRARRPPLVREAGRYEPDVTALGGALVRAKSREGDAEGAPTSAPSVLGAPTGAALVGKGHANGGPGKPRPPADPASQF